MSASARGLRVPETHVPARGDLPAYTLRMSTRARRVRLTVTPRDGLVVVVPATMSGFDPSDVLRQRRDWIADAHAHFAERRSALLAGADALLPSDVVFPATGERWGIEYRHNGTRGVRTRTSGDVLVARGPVDDAEACLTSLRRWLHRAAAERLLPWLAAESARTGLAYERASVRGQRTRWGGCSSLGSITLNRCLVFLPAELVHAVILHELVHLRYPNHSSAFWKHLSDLDPHASAHRGAIAQAWDAVPPWAEP